MAERKAVLIRLPENLWDQVNRWARDELRSANAQVEYILREAVRKRSGGGGGRRSADAGEDQDAGDGQEGSS